MNKSRKKYINNVTAKYKITDPLLFSHLNICLHFHTCVSVRACARDSVFFLDLLIIPANRPNKFSLPLHFRLTNLTFCSKQLHLEPELRFVWVLFVVVELFSMHSAKN